MRGRQPAGQVAGRAGSSAGEDADAGGVAAGGRGAARGAGRADPGAGAGADGEPARRELPGDLRAGGGAAGRAGLRDRVRARRGDAGRQRPLSALEPGGAARGGAAGAVRAFQRAYRRGRGRAGLDHRPVRGRADRRPHLRPRHLRHEGRPRGGDRGGRGVPRAGARLRRRDRDLGDRRRGDRRLRRRRAPGPARLFRPGRPRDHPRALEQGPGLPRPPRASGGPSSRPSGGSRTARCRSSATARCGTWAR